MLLVVAVAVKLVKVNIKKNNITLGSDDDDMPFKKHGVDLMQLDI